MNLHFRLLFTTDFKYMIRCHLGIFLLEKFEFFPILGTITWWYTRIGIQWYILSVPECHNFGPKG